MKKIIQNKKMGILMMAVLLSQFQLQAGWLSSFGDRLINGVANTVQSNISRKANAAVDNALDGKLGNKPNNKKTNSKNQETSITPTQDSKVSGQPSEEVQNTMPGDINKISSTDQRGRTIPFNNKFEQIDLGITKFVGELIYHKPISIGEYSVKFEEFLAPGKYRIIATGRSYKEEVNILSLNGQGQPYFGYGIIIRKIYNDPGDRLLAGQKGLDYEVEVAKGQQGLLRMGLLNMSKNGAADFFIYKIPDTAK